MSESVEGGSQWVDSTKQHLDELVKMLRPILKELPGDRSGRKLKKDLQEVEKKLDDTRHQFSHGINDEDISEDVMMRTNDCLSSMEKYLRGGGKTVAATDLKQFLKTMRDLKREVEDNYRERLLEQSSFSAKDTDKRTSSKSSPSGQSHPERGTAKLILLSLIAVVVAGVVAHKKGYYDSLIEAMSSPLDATDGIPHCGPGVGRSCDEYLLSRLKDLAKQHSSQNEHLWRTFYSAAYDHVRNDTVPKRPVVVMVLNDQPSTQRAVVQQVADTYRSVLEPLEDREGRGGVVTIEGKELTDVESEAVQRKIKTEIEEGYESGRRAVIVYDFDLLPSCSVLTFHNFCNNEDAPYTDIAILLVVTREGPLAAEDNKNLEEAVMNKFYEKWKDCPSELPQGKIDAILSRVANNVVLLR